MIGESMSIDIDAVVIEDYIEYSVGMQISSADPDPMAQLPVQVYYCLIDALMAIIDDTLCDSDRGRRCAARSRTQCTLLIGGDAVRIYGRGCGRCAAPERTGSVRIDRYSSAFVFFVHVTLSSSERTLLYFTGHYSAVKRGTIR